jgi:hypothetical protein
MRCAFSGKSLFNGTEKVLKVRRRAMALNVKDAEPPLDTGYPRTTTSALRWHGKET